MSSLPPENLFVTDALEQLLQHPAEHHWWQALMQRLDESGRDSERAYAAQVILEQAPQDGLAGLYRATALAALLPGSDWLDRSAAMLLQWQPQDANRVLAYANLQWALAVRDSSDHHGFHAILMQARLPELMRQLGDALPAPRQAPRSPVPPRPLRKVALLSQSLGNARHPPSQMAMDQLKLLTEQGIEVTLYSCQELDIPNAEHYFGCARRGMVPAMDAGWLGSELPAEVQAHISDARLSVHTRWRKRLEQIEQYQPDLVLFVGLMSPLVFALYRRYPVLGLCVHAMPPMAPVDAWLCADRKLAAVESSAWGDAVPPAAGHYHPFRIQHEVVADVPRAEFGLEPWQLVLTTIGARLPIEIAGDWAARMLEVLAADERIVWLLVGGDATLPPALASAAPGRVRCIGHTSEIGRLLAVSDIYVNPPRIGGGLSAGEAMAQGVPVVALAAGDAGAKLGAAAQPDEEHYFRHLRALIGDAAMRHHAGQLQQQHFHATLDVRQSAPSLLAACELAMQRHALRCATAPAAS